MHVAVVKMHDIPVNNCRQNTALAEFDGLEIRQSD